MKDKVVIDGVTYVPERQMATDIEHGEYVIVRTCSAGVFARYIQKRYGMEVIMVNARRLWYWSGAASLSQLAVDGPQNPAKCKFPVEVPEVTLMQVIEILPCTAAAQAKIAEVPIWKK